MCVSGVRMWRWREGMRGARKLEMRQRRWEALLGASKLKPLACKRAVAEG